jgi:putative hydrolase of the HAD superfamily
VILHRVSAPFSRIEGANAEAGTMISAVVFDLDDTLYDELEYCKSGLAAVSEFLASSWPSRPAGLIYDALWSQFAAGNRSRTFNAALDAIGIPHEEDQIQELIAVYRGHVPKIALPADSRDVLSRLKADYRLALLTDGFLPAQRLKVQTLGIEAYFETIVYTEELGRQCWKPSLAAFEKVIETLNESPAQMVYVADNEEKDFIGPNRLGLSSVQIIRRARIHKGVAPDASARARHVIHDIQQLPPLLAML